jgi:hypothetical protein
MTTPQGGVDFVPATVSIPADVQVLSVIGGTLTPGDNIITTDTEISAPSYLIGGSFQCVSGTTKPFPLIDVFWQDSTTGVTLDQEVWTMIANLGPVTPDICQWWGRGPTKANTIIIEIDNPDPTEDLTYWLYLYQSSRVVTRSDWRSPAVFAPPGYTMAPLDEQALILGSAASTAIGDGDAETWLLPVYAGQVTLTWAQNASESTQILVTGQDPSVTGEQQLFNETGLTGSGQFTFPLPRCPATLEILNRGSASADYTWSVVAQEFAS